MVYSFSPNITYMKAIDVIVRHGRLYDATNNQALHPAEGARLLLIIENEAQLHAADPYVAPTEVRSREALANAVSQAGYLEHWVLFERGQLLYFHISAGTRDGDKEATRIECLFEVELLEEFYLVLNHPDDEIGEMPRRKGTKCACVVRRCLNSQNLPHFEPVYGSSPNEAYTRTYETYFGRFGSATVNVYAEFSLDAQGRHKAGDYRKPSQHPPGVRHAQA